jgi:hypothetical protein
MLQRLEARMNIIGPHRRRWRIVPACLLLGTALAAAALWPKHPAETAIKADAPPAREADRFVPSGIGKDDRPCRKIFDNDREFVLGLIKFMHDHEFQRFGEWSVGRYRMVKGGWADEFGTIYTQKDMLAKALLKEEEFDMYTSRLKSAGIHEVTIQQLAPFRFWVKLPVPITWNLRPSLLLMEVEETGEGESMVREWRVQRLR